MAMMEIKILLARMIDRFKVDMVPQTNDEMEMTDHFTLIPKGQRCTLVFSNAG